jgi:hypothetical protein
MKNHYANSLVSLQTNLKDVGLDNFVLNQETSIQELALTNEINERRMRSRFEMEVSEESSSSSEEEEVEKDFDAKVPAAVFEDF